MVLFYPVWAVTDLGTNKLLKESHIVTFLENLSLFRKLYVRVGSLKWLRWVFRAFLGLKLPSWRADWNGRMNKARRCLSATPGWLFIWSLRLFRLFTTKIMLHCIYHLKKGCKQMLISMMLTELYGKNWQRINIQSLNPIGMLSWWKLRYCSDQDMEVNRTLHPGFWLNRASPQVRTMNSDTASNVCCDAEILFLLYRDSFK